MRTTRPGIPRRNNSLGVGKSIKFTFVLHRFDACPMNRSLLLTIVVVFLLILLPLIPSSFYRFSVAFQNGENASIVLGQSNFITGYGGGNQSGLFGPEGIAIDSKGDIWVSDSENNRVLEFTPPFASGESASLVIGQDNFSSYLCGTVSLSAICDPQGIAFDNSGNLYVVDNANNTVLEFKPPFTTGESASLVIGGTQNDTTPSSLSSPVGIAIDSSNNLWVADEGDQRVLEFKAPLSDYESASLVLGQTNLVSNSSGANQSGFDSPLDLAFDHSGNLWVTDSGNRRILEFTAPLSTGENASLVIGQPNFTSSQTVETQSILASPSQIAFDSSGNLWATDTYNGRVMEFTAPLSDGENASLVLGQDSFTSSNTTSTQSQLTGPEGLAFDQSGNLWVLDSAASRVLEFTVSGIVATASSSAISTSTTSSSTSSSASSVPATTQSSSSTTQTTSSSTQTTPSSLSHSTSTTVTSSSRSSTSSSSSALSSSYIVTVLITISVCLAVLTVSYLKKRSQF